MNIKSIVAAGVAAALPLLPSAAETFVWTGASDSFWTNAANWRVDGVAASGCPGARIFSDSDWEMPTGDTAIFDGTGATGATSVDLDGLCSIGFLRVTGADAPRYVFGKDATQTLGFEMNGGFSVEASVPAASAPIVNANLAHTANYDYDWKGKAGTGLTTYYTNACPGCVVINGAFGTRKLRPGSKTDYAEWSVAVYNVGGFEFNAEQPATGYLYSYYFRGTGSYWYNANAVVHKLIHYYNDCTVNIAKGVQFGTSKGNNLAVMTRDGCTVTMAGEGEFRVSDNNGVGYTPTKRGFLDVDYGRLQVKCAMVPNPAAADLIVRSNSSTGAGVLDLTECPSNGFTGSLVFLDYGNVRISDPDQLGNIAGIRLHRNGSASANRLDWSGAEGTLSLPVCYTNKNDFTVRNIGSGTLTVTSAIKTEIANVVFGLNGETARVVFGGSFEGSVMPKMLLTGEVGISDSADLGEIDAIYFKNGTLVFEGVGEKTFGKPLISEAGANAVVLSSGDVVTVSSLQVNAGTLDIRTSGESSRLRVAGATSSTPMPSGVTVNGLPAQFDDDGRILGKQTVADVGIAAKGDVVPNAATKKVAIVRAGTGADTTLAADATAVAALVQQQSAAATIAMGADQTLTADEIAIDDGWASLTVGDEKGRGSVSSSGTLTLRNNAASTLTVASKTAAGALSKTGLGLVRLQGGAETSLSGLNVSGGELRLDAGAYTTTDDTFFGTVTTGGRLTIGKGSSVARADGKTANSSPSKGILAVGIGSGVGGGVLAVEDGATVTARIVAGCAKENNGNEKDGIGAVYQRGGNVSVVSATGGAVPVCSRGAGHGFWSMEGGAFNLSGQYNAGCTIGEGGGIGIFSQMAGEVSIPESTLYVGNGSNAFAEWFVGGGTTTVRGVEMPKKGTYSGVHSGITVSGEGSEIVLVNSQSKVLMGGYESASASAVDNTCLANVIDGGAIAFAADGFVRSGSHQDTDMAIVNLDGGTLRFNATYSVSAFGDSIDAETGVDRVFVYSKGATIDIANGNGRVMVKTPIRGAFGGGVKSVSWTEPQVGLVGAPKVRIVGDGEGASALAVYDTTLGKVTQVVVTSPGCGYTWAKAVFHANSLTRTCAKVWTNEVEIAENACDGGLIMTGAGTLDLYAVSTYKGPTVIRQGKIVLWDDNRIDPVSKLVLAGGTLFMADHKQTFSDIDTTSGTISNGKPTVTGLVIDLEEARAGHVRELDMGMFTYAPGAAVRIEGDVSALPEGRYVLARFANGVPAEALDISAAAATLPEKWRLKFVGNTLVLRSVQGMMLIVW